MGTCSATSEEITQSAQPVARGSANVEAATTGTPYRRM
jgi:hypothetical protein